MIKNYMEILVDQIIKDLIKDEGKHVFRCTCEICLDNIKAIALNTLKPFYITSKAGEVFGTFHNMTPQNKMDVLAEVLKAKAIVENNPKHH